MSLPPPPDRAPGVVVPPGSILGAALTGLAGHARMVCLAGLPGTGKSLLIHQLAHLAHAGGRGVHLLQWDVARPIFEASRAGRAYPQERGVTHGIIRLAVGGWARAAVARWHAERAGGRDILIGETPFVGHRLIELVRPAPDPAEPVLAAPSTRFVVPVPSREVRAHLEAERARRARAPLHHREREDAPPEVLRDLWRQLVEVARTLGLSADESGAPAGGAMGAAGDRPYDPDLYRQVYEAVLVHRHVETLAVDARLPVEGISPYAFGVGTADLVPTEAEAERAIREAANRFGDPAALAREIDGWFRVAPAG